MGAGSDHQYARYRWAALLLGFVLLGTGCAAPSVLFEQSSAYNNVIVVEDERGLRTLFFEHNGARQSVVKPGDPSHLELPYLKAALAGLALRPEPSRVLVVGLGGGSLPMFLRAHYPRTAIDVVEIDPLVAEVAVRHFGFREDALLKVHLTDGRRFIEDVPTAYYDVVFLDAFGSDRIPAHLTTLEFLLATRKALAAEGVVVGNIWAPAWNRLYEPMMRTYQEAFAGLDVIEVGGDVNRIFLARSGTASLDAQTLARAYGELAAKKRFPFDAADIVLRGFTSGAHRNPAVRVLRDSEAAPDHPAPDS
jgi:spermidine synthase